ncbi:WD repeat-containing protein 55 homolog [Nilaparvata lugens]|uniref:WD repeat-containing protein 55 homolog n=1 Tax=Nilaparvata lugens TaxID=108931 RepID=UPI00193E3D58|nr:WD repeat-containing protein 55 homolog [Nilaparvata lugens]
MCNIKPSDSEEDILEVVEPTESDESDASTSIEDYYEEANEEEEEEDEEEAGSSDADQGANGGNESFTDCMKNHMSSSSRPPQIGCEGQIADISFHPQTNALAAAGISGDLVIYKYDLTENVTQRTIEVHTGACRAVEYSLDGALLFTASKDKSIVVSDSETGQFRHVFDKAHSAGLYSLSIISEHLFATGDEDGAVKLWDIRHKQPVLSVHKVKDYISSIVTNDSKRYLACTTGEGTVVSINIVAKKFHVESEPYESELTCAGLYKDEAKLVCGTATGKLLVYNWGEFGLHLDEFPGPKKKSINCQVAINDNVMVTGWEDGKISCDQHGRDTVVVPLVFYTVLSNQLHVCLFYQSEPYESELTCAGLYKDEAKLVCGTATGKLLVYNWGEFGLHLDEFPGPKKKSINCQVAINDNVMVTGWEDGKIRATHIHPNKQLGVIGQHQLSVDSLDISHDGSYIASCSLDEKISFWPIDFFNNIDLNVGIDKNTNLPSSQVTDHKTFFADLASDS